MKPFPAEPVRALTGDEVEAFPRNGVICVRQVLPARRIEVAAPGIERARFVVTN